MFMNPIEAMRKFFESMVTFKVSSIISTLTNLQVQLISKKDALSPEEMDGELNRLEDVRRILQQKLGSVQKPGHTSDQAKD